MRVIFILQLILPKMHQFSFLSSDSESDTEPIDFEKLSKECELGRKYFWKKFDDGNLS